MRVTTLTRSLHTDFMSIHCFNDVSKNNAQDSQLPEASEAMSSPIVGIREWGREGNKRKYPKNAFQCKFVVYF